MKNLLVPTDFSACASEAIYVAFQLARKHNAKVFLYHNLSLPADYKFQTLSDQQQKEEKQQMINNANSLFYEWILKAGELGVEIHHSCSFGKLIDEIEELVETHHIDFIVAGSHGASGKNEYFMGSNAQRMVRLLHCPILVVKDAAEKFTINKVIFASDFDPRDKVAFRYMLDWLAPYKPEIHLLEVNTSGWFSQPFMLVEELMKDFKELCGKTPCFTHFRRDWNVDAGIRHLAEDIGADLIVVANLRRSPIKRIFAGSNVEAVVNHAEMAVLSIDFPEKGK